MTSLPQNWNEDDITTIVNFCRGINPTEPQRCDHFETGQVCSVVGLQQWGRAWFQNCDRACRNGVQGTLDDYGFIPHPERK
jgi:hypothetical protein